MNGGCIASQVVIQSLGRAGAVEPLTEEVAASPVVGVVDPSTPVPAGHPTSADQQAPGTVHQPASAAMPQRTVAEVCSPPDQALHRTSVLVDDLLEAAGRTGSADERSDAERPGKPAARMQLHGGSDTCRSQGSKTPAARPHLTPLSSRRVCT